MFCIHITYINSNQSIIVCMYTLNIEVFSRLLSGCCRGAFRCRLEHFPLSFTGLQWLPLYHHHPPFHDEAGCRKTGSALCSAASCLSYITKVNLFSSLHGLLIGRIIFRVSRQFCVCRVIGAFVEGIRDICTVRLWFWFTVLHVSVCVSDFVFCLVLLNQSATSCLHPRWIRQSTNNSPTLQPPSIHQREVRETFTVGWDSKMMQNRSNTPCVEGYCRLLEYFQFMVLYTFTALHFRGKC